MPKIMWKTIILKGFGIYRDGIRVDLAEGLNTLVGPNETGKSTLVAGLRAILFGLPASSKENCFGTARFRSWEETDSFYGEVIFTVDGQYYRIKRQFSGHRVVISSKGPQGWRQEFSGNHNPRSSKDTGEYTQWLQKLLGITNGEVFTDSFCVEQPLPQGGELSTHIQTLLSGSGSNFSQALGWLKHEAAALTRYLKQYGFDSDNKKDRQLEILEQEIIEWERRLAAGREAAEELQTILRDRSKLEEEFTRLRKELAAKKQLKEAWGEAQQYYRRYQELLSKLQEVESVRRQFHDLEKEINEKTRALEADFGVFCQAPAEWPEQLEQLLTLEQELKVLESRLTDLEAELQTREEEGDHLLLSLQPLEAFRGNPHLLADFREYRRVNSQYEDLCSQLDDLAIGEADCREKLSQLPDWHRLGEAPLGELKELHKSARRIIRFWRQLENYQLELAQIREKLEQDYICFRNLSPVQEQALAEYPVLKLKLETALTDKDRLYQEVRGKYEGLRQSREEFRQEYGELAAIEEALLQEKLKLEQQVAENRWAARNEKAGSSKNTRALIMAGCLGAAGGVIGWFAGEFAGFATGFAVGILLGWMSGMLFPSRGETEKQKRLKELELKLTELNAKLPPEVAAMEEVELRLLQEKFQRKKLQEQLLQEEEERLTRWDLPALQQEVEQAREKLKKFRQLVQEQEAAFGDALPRAFAEYKKCIHRRQELETQIQVIMQEELQVPSFDLPRDQWPVLWQKLQILGELSDFETDRLTDIIRWLLTLDETWWQTALDSCSQWEELQTRWKTFTDKKKELETVDEQGLSLLEQYREQIARLEKQVAPYRLETPLEKVEQDALRFQELREKISGIDEIKQQLQTQINEIKTREKELNSRRDRLKTAWQAYLDLGQGDIFTVKDLWQTYQTKQQTLIGLQEKLSGLLNGVQVEKSEELEEKRLHLESQVQYCLNRLEELTGKHPGLPSFLETRERVQIEQEYRQLEEEIKELESREEVLKNRERDLIHTQAALEGKEPVNLAQGELELAQLKEKKQFIQLETKALSIAYQELTAAINDYNASYRERLAGQATFYFRRMTGSEREVVVTEDFKIRIGEQGNLRSVGQFSQGTKDQLFLALRLAIGDLLAEATELPFIFDDPFLNYDDLRLEEVRELLQHLAETRQVFFLSHRESLSAWGLPVSVEKE